MTLSDQAAAYRQASCLTPGDDAAWHNLAVTALHLGRTDEARRLLRRTLRLAPANAGAYYSLSTAHSFEPDDPALTAMERLERHQALLPPEGRVRLAFALAKAYADCGEPERSFARLVAGNAEKRGLIDYREGPTLALFDRLRALSPLAFSEGRDADGPIFIVGMPRSGSTLLEQILASHSQIVAAGEINLFGASLHAMLRGRRFPDAIADFSDDDYAEIGALYRDGLKHFAGPGRRLVNKLPENFLFLGLIRRALPDARLIHARREPLDTCLSCFSHLFTVGQPYSYHLGELGRYYRRYADLMAHWRRSLPAGSLLEIDYEALVADQEGETRRLLDFCGLPWEAACLAFHATERPVLTGSVVQVRQPLYRSSVGRWRPPAALIAPLTEALAR